MYIHWINIEFALYRHCVFGEQADSLAANLAPLIFKEKCGPVNSFKQMGEKIFRIHRQFYSN